MKQCLIVKSGTTLASGTAYDLTKLAKGQIGFFGLDDSTYVSDAALSKDFGIAVGGGENVRAFVVPEVDFNSLSVAKSGPQEGMAKVVTINADDLKCPSDKPNVDLVFVITRKGRKFNERSNWTITITNPDKSNEGITAICARINAAVGEYGYFAEYKGTGIMSITGPVNEDFEFCLGACDFYFTDPSSDLQVTDKFVPSTNLKADIQELALACAAGKAVNYLSEDGKELYPNFPVEVDSDKYVVYTLRFAVGRAAAKQRDEKVTQTVHIAVPSDSAVVTSLDTLFGVA